MTTADHPTGYGKPKRCWVTEFVVLNVPPSEGFASAANAVAQVRGVKKITQDPDAGVVKAKVGISIKSWGEVLEVAVSEDPAGSVARVWSAPALGTTAIDFGKNRSNVEQIIEILLAKHDGHRRATAEPS